MTRATEDKYCQLTFVYPDGNSVFTNLATIPVGNTFTYAIRYENGQLSVAVNDGAFHRRWIIHSSYFKVINYNQADFLSEVHIQTLFNLTR